LDIIPCKPLKSTDFRANLSSPSSGSNNPSKISTWKQVASWYHPRSIWPGIWRMYMFLRNVGWLSTDHAALYPRRQYSSMCYSFRESNPCCYIVQPVVDCGILAAKELVFQ
jgi:hypothetical protein